MRISDWSSDVCSSDLDPGEEEDSSVPFDLPPPPPPGSGRFSMALPEDLGGRPLPEVKKELRDANADLAMDLVRFTGLSHRQVNGRLTRLAAVTSITEATLDHLRHRADPAARCLASLSGAPPRPPWVHAAVVCGFRGHSGHPKR